MQTCSFLLITSKRVTIVYPMASLFSEETGCRAKLRLQTQTVKIKILSFGLSIPLESGDTFGISLLRIRDGVYGLPYHAEEEEEEEWTS